MLFVLSRFDELLSLKPKIKARNECNELLLNFHVLGAIMAKAGKRVLVLEQHDQAGGCCHTFIDKGYEFDVGIHYIGKMSQGQFNRQFLDQISEGQIEWNPLEDAYDIVSIGNFAVFLKHIRFYKLFTN